MNRSIRWWLAMLAIAAALPLLILVAALFFSQLRTEERDARERALRIAEGAAERIRDLHADSIKLLQQMSARPAIQNADPSRCDSLFAVVDFFPQYLNLLLLDRRGSVLCSAVPQPQDQALSDKAREWVAGEVRAGVLRDGDPLIRLIDGQWVSALGTNVASAAGTQPAILVLVQLPDIVGPEQLPPGSVITLINGEGRVLARSRDGEQWIGRTVRGTEVTEIVLQRGHGRTEAQGIDGVSRQYGFTRIAPIGWFIYVGVPTASVMEPVREQFQRGIFAGALIVALAVAASLALARYVQRPVNALSRAAGAIARDGYSGRVPVDGPLEIAGLGQAFNEMVEMRSQAEARIVASERNLKALSDRLLTIQEEERTRIARELHDDLGQALTALKMDIGGLLRMNETSSAPAKVRERIMHTLDSTVESVQRITAELRPSVLDDLGLVAAIEGEARLFEERTGIECDVSVPAGGADLVGPVATAIYRIVQEALTNVARHSNATRVEIRLRSRTGELLLEVRDDGRGIRKEEIEDRRSLGLIGMRERAAIIGGSVEVEGIEERGTILTVRIPIEAGT
ncbi:MAG TPA: ATP-binding protein [Thermoanaerobaculia bacterium]|nr:ATP-binding protein [Thermoanaerobaculia bacterium]